jgi:cobaltochelatase CobN
VARILGGQGYWPYGLAQYSAALHARGIPFAALPGDDKPDAELRALSTVPDSDYVALWSCLVEGGLENARRFLLHARHLLDGTQAPPPAKPLLKAGSFWPGLGEAELPAIRQSWISGAPVVPVVFYRALVQSGAVVPVAHLTRALLRQGLNPLPVYVASLKDPLSRATLAALFREAPPAVILNATSFAVGTPETLGENPLAAPEANEAPVLQVVFSGSSEAQWAEGARGLSATDIAMNVALPELDGRILTRAVSFKDEAHFDEATQCPIVTYAPRADRVRFVAELAANWARLRATPPADRKVALVLANYPNKDGRLANGVGLDTPASTVHALRLLKDAGYGVEDAPADSDALMARLLAGPTNWLPDRKDKRGGERLPLSAYRAWFDVLPWEVKLQVSDRWGLPEQDPYLDGDCFALSIHRFGHAVVALQPSRGYDIDAKATYHAPDLVPPHHYLAFYVWLRQQFGAHALVHMGKHGNLEWLPGKAVALSAECWPEIALGPLPHLYPLIVNDQGEGTQANRHAPPDASRDIRPPPRPRGPARRAQPRPVHRPPPRRAPSARDRHPRPGHRHRLGRWPLRCGRPPAPRRLALRPEGGADPRRPPRLRTKPSGHPRPRPRYRPGPRPPRRPRFPAPRPGAGPRPGLRPPRPRHVDPVDRPQPHCLGRDHAGPVAHPGRHRGTPGAPFHRAPGRSRPAARSCIGLGLG